MKYDFTTIINRQGKDAMAVDAPGKFPSFPLPEDGFDFIPMWVADMNFATAPTDVYKRQILQLSRNLLITYLFR